MKKTITSLQHCVEKTKSHDIETQSTFLQSCRVMIKTVIKMSINCTALREGQVQVTVGSLTIRGSQLQTEEFSF